MKTYSAKPSEIEKKWWVIDAKNIVLGRLASRVANMLRGKHKPSFTPHLDCGDNIIIINAEHVKLTGKKANPKDGKIYYRYTGFPGGIKDTTAGKILSGKHPERVIKMAVKRMITRNALGAKQMSNLYVYVNGDHPHMAQQPTVYDFASQNPKNKK
ncbi:50S ribosomal protein L13 [Rickettsia amblyommatis]|uniref:Large ribosomal subunit protein uL13 n=2 Tax=Rickettsia amblyommatis TaxID=33989 RepID=H8K4I6_RICAG|nr:50S ribosomal protein L13 [Rickettsia amblyommatis]AFC69430.1 50S ribosomal protein L13 [Rickettsia amblyommatis str. GAT-30V]ALA61554.1 50S ribosomal protein L13 [Rickettsia amblyommatis]ARD87663.1 50S ribosomal protein L13 [Rickettsia amblyommatis]KJV61722.1 ribosomal protein L13 [Rickettsia amblyommatis str. Ac/Pa]KJV99143.1 ribosomal protein L13 [Rickettsia amblyommatis str. Darkwater]